MHDIEYAPGTFCWAELVTSDAAAAKKFYTELMDWEIQEDHMSESFTYTTLLRTGKPVAALFELFDELKAQGVPPHWMPYVRVTDAAETAARVQRLGGTVLRECHEVMDYGALAVLTDPTGAAFSIWQPNKHQGAQLESGTPGTVCWHELATSDTDRASAFYSELFGWKPRVQDMGTMQYTTFMNGDAMAAGMLKMGPEWGGIPPHWMIYLSVDDCDARADKAASLGGKIMVPPTDVPSVGRFALIQDPQGAFVSIMKLSNPLT